ncbi:hypothetical protein [Anaerosacchariphilus polymeriproducens]|uniref:Uncharacterized protein n=1 Tax=Anaerosacchariphilus polymeriproducens TaxID=1812858 RepID=A0A371AUG1_9FIRM|nr:hypothetical protein [Anaerosacchariphilus polymeriproducens]RDU23203.1 hypothetical protein DWV06_10505 [Anaerosacchariphilus polymeriproducens]
MKQAFLLISKIIYIVFMVSLLSMLIIVFQEEKSPPFFIFFVVGILLVVSAVLSIICCLIMFVLEMRIEWKEQGIRCVGKFILEIILIFAFFLLMEYVYLKEGINIRSYLFRSVIFVIGSRGIGTYLLRRKGSTI